MTTELSIFSDYHQIYHQIELVDGDPEKIVAWDHAHWVDDHMAIAENAAAIMTGVNARVHITVEVGRAAPIDDSHAFDTVFEFGLRVDSGRLTVTSPMSWPGEQVPVPEDGCVSGRPCRHRLAITTTPHRTTRKVGDVSDSSAGRVIAPTPA